VAYLFKYADYIFIYKATVKKYVLYNMNKLLISHSVFRLVTVNKAYLDAE